jgi:hypothetical protein
MVAVMNGETNPFSAKEIVSKEKPSSHLLLQDRACPQALELRNVSATG